MVKISKLKKYKFKAVFLYGRDYYCFSKTEKTKTFYRLRYLNKGNAVMYQNEKEILNCVKSCYLSMENEQILALHIRDATKENNEKNIKRDISVLKELLYWMYGV